MEPHCAATIFRLELSIRENRDYEVRQAALQEKLKTVSAEKISISLLVLMSYNLFFLCQLRFGGGGKSLSLASLFSLIYYYCVKLSLTLDSSLKIFYLLFCKLKAEPFY
jgi:hypothetical protein